MIKNIGAGGKTQRKEKFKTQNMSVTLNNIGEVHPSSKTTHLNLCYIEKDYEKGPQRS